MKQKYTISIAGTEMNVITDEAPEFVDEVVGILDRKMREINTASKHCSKTEAAFLCALDYCSDKVRLTKKNRSHDAELALKNAQLNRLTAENERISVELERLEAEMEKLRSDIRELSRENDRLSAEHRDMKVENDRLRLAAGYRGRK